jgi:hypothetical protein
VPANPLVVIPDSVDADLTEDQYYAILRADIDGNEAATAFLMQDAEEWLQRLIELFQSIETQFSQRKAEAMEFQNACLRKGGRGKQEWFDYKQEWDTWRGSANHLKKLVVARQREVKTIRSEQNRDNHPGFHDRQITLLQEILASLQRIEQKLP